MMDNKKIMIDVICGGESGEHEVSVLSAVSISNGLLAMNDRYHVYGLYITARGEWFRSKEPLHKKCDPQTFKNLSHEGIKVSPSVNPNEKIYFGFDGNRYDLPDIYFPVLHGTKGEDGVIQGLFELMNIPYVGSGVEGGMCGMDKAVMRTLFEEGGLPVLPWRSVTLEEWEEKKDTLKPQIEEELGFPIFVKPSNLGSSVGISKAHDSNELESAMKLAFEFGNKAVLEEGREVREIECAVLGNEKIQVSDPGEIIPGSEFYDYNDKYHGNKAKLSIPADLSLEVANKVKDYAGRAFLSVNAKGLSRVDFFICKKTKALFVNEINTFPGFTNISMYPKLWEYSGIPFGELIQKLIDLGFDHHARENRFKRSATKG